MPPLSVYQTSASRSGLLYSAQARVPPRLPAPICYHHRSAHAAFSPSTPVKLPDDYRSKQHTGDKVHPDNSQSVDSGSTSKRQLLLAAATFASLISSPSSARAEGASVLAGAPSSSLDTSITHKVQLKIGIAETALKPSEERGIGDKTAIPDAEEVGTITIGLYGNLAPYTVGNFLKLVQSGVLEGTTFSRVLPGEYIQAGKQGSRKMGELERLKDLDLQSNQDLLDPDCFKLPHLRPGTVSLNLSESDDDPRVAARPDYVNVEFLITTGPGPIPRLDERNIVFGRVLEGLGTIGVITQVPTFTASDLNLAYNQFASFLGDERAAIVRRKYGRPFKAVVIQKATLVEQNAGS